MLSAIRVSVALAGTHPTALPRPVGVQIATIYLRIGDQNGELCELDRITAGILPTATGSQGGLVEVSNDGQWLVVMDRRVVANAPGVIPVDVYDARGAGKASLLIQRAPTKVNTAGGLEVEGASHIL